MEDARLEQESLFFGPWSEPIPQLPQPHTSTWRHPIINYSSIIMLSLNIFFQMSITDAFFAFNLGAPPNAEQPSFPEWLSRLSYQLIHNDFDQVSLQSPLPAARRAQSVAQPKVLLSHEQHQLMNLTLLSPYNLKPNPRRQCSVKGCHRKTELFCADCSKIDHTNGHRLFFCCGSGQRVTSDRRETIDGVRNPAFGLVKTTQPLCYKYHLDHVDDDPHCSEILSDGSSDSD
jgi:hypothetical protein